MSAPSPTRWLVDGYNVLHTALLHGRERGHWWKEEGRRRLLDRVGGFAEGAVCVIFDGSRPADEAADRRGPEVVFAPSADDWLLRTVRAAEEPGAIAVVTADRKVADRARHAGAVVVAPRAFLDRCPDPAKTD